MSERAIYWIVGVILGVLLIVMLVAWEYDRSNEEAEEKAQQLIAAYEEAGLTPPAKPEMIARVLGDDGGVVCETAGDDLMEAHLKLRLGVGGEFYHRPVRVDEDTVKGLLLIVGIYCPDKLPDVEDFVDDLDFDDVIRD
jgi:hypothetical protein